MKFINFVSHFIIAFCLMSQAFSFEKNRVTSFKEERSRVLSAGPISSGGGNSIHTPLEYQDVVVAKDWALRLLPILMLKLESVKNSINFDEDVNPDSNKKGQDNYWIKELFPNAERDVIYEIKNTPIVIEATQPCFDLAKRPSEGSYSDKNHPNQICLSYSELKKTNFKENIDLQILALIAHEVSHKMGFRDAEDGGYAEELQHFFLSSYPSNLTSILDVAENEIDFIFSSLETTYEHLLDKNLNILNLCMGIGRIKGLHLDMTNWTDGSYHQISFYRHSSFYEYIAEGGFNNLIDDISLSSLCGGLSYPTGSNAKTIEGKLYAEAMLRESLTQATSEMEKRVYEREIQNVLPLVKGTIHVFDSVEDIGEFREFVRGLKEKDSRKHHEISMILKNLQKKISNK